MAKKKDRYAAYVYEETKYSGKGILATVLGGVSLLIFLVLVGVCILIGGTAGEWIGTIGFTAFAVAFYGLVTGLQSFRQQCKSYIFCKVGTLFCGFMVAVWFLIFCMGLAS